VRALVTCLLSQQQVGGTPLPLVGRAWQHDNKVKVSWHCAVRAWIYSLVAQQSQSLTADLRNLAPRPPRGRREAPVTLAVATLPPSPAAPPPKLAPGNLSGREEGGGGASSPLLSGGLGRAR
jgi:hypothetical protein